MSDGKAVSEDVVRELREQLLQLANAQAQAANAILSLGYLANRQTIGGSPEAEKVIADSDAAFARAVTVAEALEKALGRE